MPSSDSLREATVGRAAAQWIALGCQLAGEAESSVVDLEALIGITAELAASSPRVYEASLDWCVAYGAAVNSARLKNVAAYIGVRDAALAEYAASVRGAGGPRWPMAGTGPAWRTRGKVVVTNLSLRARLVWRVRLAFGVNARSDILVALLSMAGAAISVADLARNTHYTKRNVAQAVDGMRLAGVVAVDRVGNEDRVRVPAESPLRAWLWPQPAQQPVDWPARWRVALRLIDALTAQSGSSALVRAIEVRAAIEPLLGLFDAAALPRPDPTSTGPAFAEAFDAWVDQIAVLLGSVGH
jgi:hypothetical protein